MGLFFPSDPVIHGQRATGLPRYQELLERDWKSFLFADFVTLGLCIPYGLGVGYALLSSSLLVLIPVCVVGGLLVGPAISCMMDALFRSYRDAPRGWWENYCKGMKQNWKASLLPGVVFSLALGIELFFGMVLFSGERLPGIGTMAVFLAGLLILFMLFTAFWPQVVLFEESNLHRLQNAVLFCLKYGKHVLGAAVLQLVWWLLFVLFLPWTGFLVPFLGVWFIWFVCFFLLYNDFNAAYGIEEKISQQFPEQTPACIEIEQNVQRPAEQQWVPEHKRPVPEPMPHHGRLSAAEGSYRMPPVRNSKCRCAPVARPVCPAVPSRWPAATTSPART